ncbi:MAG TPA: DUF4126 domain-containing protein [Chthoniobacterales bacterium]
MEQTLQLLGLALGLASLAGLNLYLTVFATGLALRMDWVQLSPAYAQLQVLEHPVVLGISGALFLAEFVADKVPWFDSVWDSVHTSIRPIGAALLAVCALGDANPIYEVAVGMLAGTAALTTHGLKSGTRLLANASPEPFSNVGLSLAGDGVVLGGLGLLAFHPLTGLGIFLAVAALLVFLLPKVIRKALTRFQFAWSKLNTPAADQPPGWPPTQIPISAECELHRVHPTACEIAWVLPCVSRKGVNLAPDRRGWLAGIGGTEGSALYFIWKALFRTICVRLPVGGRPQAEFKPGFLYDSLTLRAEDGAMAAAFLVDRQHRETARRAAENLNQPPRSNPAEAPVPSDLAEA